MHPFDHGERDSLTKLHLLAAAALAISFQTATLAQERARITEDAFVVNDPEVAAPGKWKIGGALEYWYVRETTNPPQGSGTSHVTFDQVGANAFVGYDNFTLQYARRSGDEHLETSANVGGMPFTTSQDIKRVDNELTIRWLARDLATRFVTPYLIAGYARADSQADIAITTGQKGGCTGTTSYRREFDLTAPVLGVGGIFPFTETMGARLDGKYKRYRIHSHSLGACPEVSTNGDGGDLTATGYYLITPTWSLQLGAKYQTVPGAAIQNAPGIVVAGNTSKRLGAFGMLGYSHEF